MGIRKPEHVTPAVLAAVAASGALRILFAAHPELLTPVLRIIHRVIARFLA